MKQKLALLFALATLAACQSIAAPPQVRANAHALSQYVFRGLPRHAHPVLQGDMTVIMRTPTGEAVEVGSWASLALTRASGDGALTEGLGDSSGQAGNVLESRFRVIAHGDVGDTEIGIGLTTYDFPNLGVAGGSTAEVLAYWKGRAFWTRPSISVYYDIDEVEGVYADLRLDKDLRHTERLTSTLSARAAYTDENHAEALYGAAVDGLADLGASWVFAFAASLRTTLTCTFAYSTLTNDDFVDALAARGTGFESDNFWAGLGVSWGY